MNETCMDDFVVLIAWRVPWSLNWSLALIILCHVWCGRFTIYEIEWSLKVEVDEGTSNDFGNLLGICNDLSLRFVEILSIFRNCADLELFSSFQYTQVHEELTNQFNLICKYKKLISQLSSTK